MGKFQNSWDAFRTSLNVMEKNKKLIIFPVLTAAMTAVIFLFFIAPIALRPTGYHYSQPEHWKAVASQVFEGKPAHVESAQAADRNSVLVFTPQGAAYLTLLYFFSMFFSTFFNVAFTKAVLDALRDSRVSIGAALRFAGTKVRCILFWSLFAGLVGLLIRKLEQQFSFIGRIVIGFIGMAWSVAAVFAIPAIVTEQVANPLDILRKSAETLKKTWGESLVGYAGLQFGGIIAILISIVFLGAGFYAAVALNSLTIGLLTALGWLGSLSAFAYLSGVAGQIYKCVLFVYATEGTVPAGYSREMLDMAWSIKKQ